MPEPPVSTLSRRIADDRVVAAAADRVLNHRAAGDTDIANPRSDVREGFGVQVDQLVRSVAGIVERIDAALSNTV